MDLFPIQDGDDVAWEQGEKAHDVYNKIHYNGQTVQRIAERGGFSWAEYQTLLALRKCPMREWTDENFRELLVIYNKARKKKK